MPPLLPTPFPSPPRPPGIKEDAYRLPLSIYTKEILGEAPPTPPPPTFPSMLDAPEESSRSQSRASDLFLRAPTWGPPEPSSPRCRDVGMRGEGVLAALAGVPHRTPSSSPGVPHPNLISSLGRKEVMSSFLFLVLFCFVLFPDEKKGYLSSHSLDMDVAIPPPPFFFICC